MNIKQDRESNLLNNDSEDGNENKDNALNHRIKYQNLGKRIRMEIKIRIKHQIMA